MRPILSSWHSISERLGATACRLVLLTFGHEKQGVPHRSRGFGVPVGLLKKLSKLAARKDFLVGVVSPLSLAEVRSFVRNPRLVCVASHGLEIADGGRSYMHPKEKAEKQFLVSLAFQLRAELSAFSKWVVRNRGLGLLVQGADGDSARVKRIVESLIARHPDHSLVVEPFGNGLEIFPDLPWNEASAVQWIERLMPQRSSTIYIGSQGRDEAVFERLKHTGIGIRIHAKHSSAASFYLLRRKDIPVLLDRLLSLSQGSGC